MIFQQMARVFLDVQFNKFQYPIIKQIQQFKPHFQCHGLFPLWIIDKKTFNGWISDAKIGLFYKLTNMWEGSLVLLLLWCYFSTLLKHYGDHYMVQSISSWLASAAITAAIIGQSIWKKRQMAHPMLHKVVPNFQKVRNGYMNLLWWNCPICG